RVNVPKPGGWAPSRQFSTQMREALAGGTDRLVVAFNSFAGGDLDREVVQTLAGAGVPFLEGTESAMQALRHARDHRRFLERRRERAAARQAGLRAAAPAATPPLGTASGEPLPAAHLGAARGVLSSAAAMALLRPYRIPLVETVAAKNSDGAVSAAEGLGYPVVLKIDSPDILHKTDVGGVRVGVADGAAVRRACDEMLAEVRRRAPAARIDGVVVQPMVRGGIEMILGVKRDPIFGPAIVCGFGGVFVEVMRDLSIRVPPIDLDEAREMIAELRGAALLRGARGRPRADVAALADTLVKLAALAEAHRDRLLALDVNPLLVLDEGQGVVAVDWLVELA
ncbi:MAG: acetate--CoA ligase family protein, partial [Candidatus Rokubacteria bacterium]|nr:acetate--CoA ligase family protein [Candidatus Rokubacteria bacterium]